MLYSTACKGEAPLKFRQGTLPLRRTDGREEGVFSLFFLKEKQLEETAFLPLLSLYLPPSVLSSCHSQQPGPPSFPRLIEYIS